MKTKIQNTKNLHYAAKPRLRELIAINFYIEKEQRFKKPLYMIVSSSVIYNHKKMDIPPKCSATDE